MIEILFDELADPNDQDLIFFYGDVKQNMQKNLMKEYHNTPWNIATLQNGYLNALIINKQEDGKEFQVFLQCGFFNGYKPGSTICSENSKTQSGEPFYSVYSSAIGSDIQVTCSELGTFRENSAEYLKLDFICRDRKIKITSFQVALVVISVILLLIAIGCCSFMLRLKPSEVTVLVGANNNLRRNVRGANA